MNPDSHDRDIGGYEPGNSPGVCSHNKATGHSALHPHQGIVAPVPRRIALQQAKETAIARKERIAGAPWIPPPSMALKSDYGAECGLFPENMPSLLVLCMATQK